MSSLGDAVKQVIVTERNRATLGVPLVVCEKSFNRSKLIRRIVEHCLSGDYDPAVYDPPTALVCTHKDRSAQEHMQVINRSLPTTMRGQMLRTDAPQSHINALTFGSYGALQRARISTDAFDFVVVDARVPGELNHFRGWLAKLEPTFTVLILSKPMHDQGELKHWPHLEPAHIVQRASRRQPAPPAA